MISCYTACVIPIISLLCFGCTKVPLADDCRVTAIVNDKIDKEVHWNRFCYKDEQVHCAIQRLLQKELVIDTATQIALLNNPEIQAVFDDIGIALADLVEAGLFQNPIFDAYIRFPDHRFLQLNTAFSVTQSFLDIFLIPLRKKIAAVELEQAYIRVANAVLKVSFDVQETFYHFQAAQAKQHYLALLVQATEAANQLAAAQMHQGNINGLEFQSRMNEYLESKAAFTQNQIELIRLREQMNKLLGLSSSELRWRITDKLPVLPKSEISIDCLESVALSQSLDLEIARLEVKKISKMLGLKQWWAYTDVAAGISTEHEAERFQETGPAFAGAIPIFNYGQADRARLYSMYYQSLEKEKALEIQVLSQVRSAREQLLINRNLVLTYQNELLPLQEQIVSISQRFYNTMSLSVYKLLEAKKQELQMQINHKLNLRNYWISRVELDRALGGDLHLAVEKYRQSVYCESLRESE